MKKKVLHYAKETLVFIVLLTIATNLLSLYKSSNLTTSQILPQSFTLLNSKNYTINKQKPLLIHFWATWCPVCKAEAQNIEYLSKSYQVITVAVKSGSTQEIEDYLKERDLDFMVYNDVDGAFSKKFNINVYPTTIIYDKEQNIKFSDVGYTTTIGLYFRMLLASF